MAHRLFLYCEHNRHMQALQPLLQDLNFEVVAAPQAWLENAGSAVPFCPLAVVAAGIHGMEPAIVELRRRKLASKMLAMVPFELQGLEAHLMGIGADDVLLFPVSRARLEITLHNLLRLHFLERALHTPVASLKEPA